MIAIIPYRSHPIMGTDIMGMIHTILLGMDIMGMIHNGNGYNGNDTQWEWI